MYRSSVAKPTSANSSELVQYHGGAAADGVGLVAVPGSVAMRGGRVVAAGEPSDVTRTIGRPDREVELPGQLLIPALVNAHAHLELTAVRRFEYDGSFTQWLQAVRQSYPDPADVYGQENRDYFARSAAHGARLAAGSGTRALADITRFDEVFRAQEGAGLAGVSFAELFGLGPPWSDRAAERIDEVVERAAVGSVRRGLQPHAPYSAGPAVFGAAAASGLPVATHLAESPDELRFVARGDGPFRELLRQLGKWDDRFAGHYRGGLSPVAWLASIGASRTDWLCAHCNYVSDEDIGLLADRGWSVAYCPRASEYFGHAGHRYRDMLNAGVNVALGTDSTICHGSLSVLDEMRRLYQRDRTEPQTLLAMATACGMKALGLDPADATFAEGASPGLLAVRYDAAAGVDPLAAVLASRASPLITVLELPT